MGIGVPDITINIGASTQIPILSDYYLLSVAEYISIHRGATLSEVSNYFSFELSKCQCYINRLLERKLVSFKRNVYYIRRKILNLNLGTTIAIEAKIKDWRTGILQAQRYLLFSNYSYLALPKDKVRNVNNLQLLESGIGLLSVDGTKISEVISPAQSQICDYKQKYIVTSEILTESHDIIKRRADGVFSKLVD